MSRLIVALDCPDARSAAHLVNMLGEAVEWYKVGSVLFTAAGPSVVEHLRSAGKRVFLDLKFCDIPATVSGAVSSACRLGAELITVHLLGGKEMVSAAARARDASGSGARIVGVTVLTSFDDAAALEVGLALPASQAAEHLAVRAVSWGADGVVCSAVELERLRPVLPPPLLLVCPGIRPAASGDDQKRTGTPAEAVRRGADFLVVGRPVTAAPDPAAAVSQILEEMRNGEAGVDQG